MGVLPARPGISYPGELVIHHEDALRGEFSRPPARVRGATPARA